MNMKISLNALGKKESLLFQFVLISAFLFASPLGYIGLIILLILKLRYAIEFGLKISKYLYFLSLIFIACLVFGLIINGFHYVAVSVHVMIVISVLFFIGFYVQDLADYFRSSRTILLLFQLIVIGVSLKIGFNNFPLIVPLENMIPGSSANGISSYLVVIQVNYMIAKFYYKGKPAYLTTILTLIIALTAYGRGSILASALLLVISFVIGFFSKVRLKEKIVLTCILICSVMAVLSNLESISLFLEANTKLSNGLVDEHRSKILAEYTQALTWKSIIFGDDYPYLVERFYNGNPHNSFLRTHHLFGLPLLMCYVILPFTVMWMANTNSKKMLLFLCFLVVGFRSFSEPIIAPTLLDFYFLSSFFMVPLLDTRSNISM